jgi:hypothetical protein
MRKARSARLRGRLLAALIENDPAHQLRPVGAQVSDSALDHPLAPITAMGRRPVGDGRGRWARPRAIPAIRCSGPVRMLVVVRCPLVLRRRPPVRRLCVDHSLSFSPRKRSKRVSNGPPEATGECPPAPRRGREQAGNPAQRPAIAQVRGVHRGNREPQRAGCRVPV